MRYRNPALIAVAALALGTAVMAAPAVAQKSSAAAQPNRVTYEFHGLAVNNGVAGQTSIVVQVTGGNKPALKKLLGAAQPTTFALDNHTKFVIWHGTTPSVGNASSVLAGDTVDVTVNAPGRATLADIAATPLNRVGDSTNATRPTGRLFLYFGTADAVDTVNHTITLKVTWGNWRALYSMLGNPVDETFTYDAKTTVFLHWNGKGPHLIDPSLIKAGDPVTVRVIAPLGTPLSTLTHTPLFRVNDHEPMALVVKAAGPTG
jgi:hypothetical protein